jgi:hypothetical protein
VALSVLSALALCRVGAARKLLITAAVLAVVTIESLAAPLPLTAVPLAGVYTDVAKDHSSAAVLPVPFGLRDGFGERGRVAGDAILQQTVHHHALAGGFIARLPPDIGPWYDAHEPFATLLRLSSGETRWSAMSCQGAHDGFAAAHIGFVVLYADAPEPARQFVSTLPLERIADDGERVLFRTVGCPGT